MCQWVFSFLFFNFLETSVFYFCYVPGSNAEANSASLSNLLVCSFSPVTPSLVQKSSLGSEISRKFMLKWTALNFLCPYINAICYIQICAMQIYVWQNTEIRISEFLLSLADDYIAKRFGEFTNQLFFFITMWITQQPFTSLFLANI